MERMLKVAQVADILGLAKITVYKLVKDRAIPHYRLGKCIRFKGDEVIAWLREVLSCPDAEVEEPELLVTQKPSEP